MEYTMLYSMERHKDQIINPAHNNVKLLIYISLHSLDYIVMTVKIVWLLCPVFLVQGSSTFSVL